MTTDERFERLNSRFDRLDSYLLRFREETTQRLNVVDIRLDALSEVAASIDRQLPVITKAILDFGILAGKLAREQMESSDLAERVARLEEQLSHLTNPPFLRRMVS